MRIEKAIVEDEIDTDEDIILTQNTTFRKKLKCRSIISENTRWNINAMDINAWDINAMDINAMNINAMDINAMDINAWDINAMDINAWDINAGNINAWDINAGNINARNIDAWNINAWDIDVYYIIICEKRKKKSETAKTMSRIFITKKSELKQKEHEVSQ